MESLVSIVIIAIVVVTGANGVVMSMRVSGEQRQSARGETLLRSAAEQIQNPEFAYVVRAGCPGRGAYVVPAPAETEPGYVVSVSSVTFWSGSSPTPTASVTTSFASACPASDADDRGLQRIVLVVSDASGAFDSLTVLKRRL